MDLEVRELALKMPTKAAFAIQGSAEGWGGSRPDHTLEAGVAALLKRVRGDVNRYKLQAADAPIDNQQVAAEIRESIIPVIGQFAHAGLLATGLLPEPQQYAAEWEIVFAHLRQGTSLRARFGTSSRGSTDCAVVGR